MTRILINRSYGGFSLSREAILWLQERGSTAALAETLDDEGSFMESYFPQIDRDDPLLLECFETLGKRFYPDDHSTYKIVEIPDEVKEWEVSEAEGGYEWIAEKHRTWC